MTNSVRLLHSRPPVKKLICTTFAATVLLIGCSPESYKRSADTQVQAILRDRKEKTLGYRPQTIAETTVSDKPGPDAYVKIPQTPIPPPTTSPVEPSSVELTWGPLGPQMLFPAGFEGGLPITVDVGELGGLERLRLGPPAPGNAPLRFDLFRSLAYAVRNSRDYQDQMENVYLTTLDVTLERHLFEPRPFARTGFRVNGGGSDIDYATALSVTNAVGVRQRWA